MLNLLKYGFPYILVEDPAALYGRVEPSLTSAPVWNPGAIMGNHEMTFYFLLGIINNFNCTLIKFRIIPITK